MSDMKCPFCQRELLMSSYRDDDIDHQMWSCLSCQLSAQRKIWQELIHVRKALDLAKDTLHWYDDNYNSVVARNTLDEITTIEQKDVK